MVEVFKSGLMDRGTMDSGETEWLMDMDDLFMPKEMFMRENGLRTKLMDLVFTLTIMVVDMKDSGFKINNMDMVSNNGQMEPNMRVNTNKE